MKKIIYLAVFMLFCFSCTKNKVKNTDITIFGELTNLNKSISVVENMNFESNSTQYISNGLITLSNSTNNYNYSFLDTNYKPNLSFSLNSNELYNFTMTTLDSTYQSSFLMPTPIVINNLIHNDDDYYSTINLHLSATQSKYFKIELYSATIDSVSADTTWIQNHLPLKIYNCLTDTNIRIVTIEDNYEGDEYDLVKINLRSLDFKAAKYFETLYDYRKNQSTTNQFINPPLGEFSNAYGIIYGTVLSTFIKAN